VKIVISETVLKCVQKKSLELKFDFFYEIGIRFNESYSDYFSANTLHCTQNEVTWKKI
jgi:hypothetical protein